MPVSLQAILLDGPPRRSPTRAGHFDFEDRNKVVKIVIPKLMNDDGLVAAFQNKNIESLRKQKFSESLENGFITSAGDFHAVLNRIAKEPDFRRLLTDLALGEFRRGIADSDVAGPGATP